VAPPSVATLQRIIEVIAETTTTVVPDDFLDALLDALERPPKKNDALARLARQRRRVTQH
jgi:uncharacterized protein (DUF1778 family)